MSNEEIREKVLTDAMAELKSKACAVIESIMSGLYTDYLPHVVSDTESNIAYRVEGCLKNLIEGKIERASPDMIWLGDGYGNKHCVHLGIHTMHLKHLCDIAGKTIENNRIKQLENEVELLRSQLNASYRR